MRTRLLTAAIAIPIALAAVFSGHLFPISLLAILATATALWELGRFFNLRTPLLGLVLLIAALLLASQEPDAASTLSLLLLLLLMQAGGVFGAFAAIKSPNAVTASVSSLWVACPLAGAVLLHGGKLNSWAWDWYNPLLLVLLPLWAGDTAAIFAGKAFGGPLMAPSISPKKTWSGSVANFLASALVGVGVAALLRLPLWVGGGAGVLVGVLGQAGDLFESYLKRKAGVKDSGGLLPGHGGILDRIDSLLFTALPVAILWALYLNSR